MRGPPPTPTSILRLRGSWRANTRPDEPRSEIAAPDCPEFLDACAKAEWDRIVPTLIQRQTISLADRAMLAAYCQAWSEFEWAVKELSKNRRASAVKLADTPRYVLRHAFERMHKTAQEFGLSPASRTRLRIESESRALSDKSEFFGHVG